MIWRITSHWWDINDAVDTVEIIKKTRRKSEKHHLKCLWQLEEWSSYLSSSCILFLKSINLIIFRVNIWFYDNPTPINRVKKIIVSLWPIKTKVIPKILFHIYPNNKNKGLLPADQSCVLKLKLTIWPPSLLLLEYKRAEHSSAQV